MRAEKRVTCKDINQNHYGLPCECCKTLTRSITIKHEQGKLTLIFLGRSYYTSTMCVNKRFSKVFLVLIELKSHHWPHYWAYQVFWFNLQSKIREWDSRLTAASLLFHLFLYKMVLFSYEAWIWIFVGDKLSWRYSP